MHRSAQLQRIAKAFWIALALDFLLGIPAFVCAYSPGRYPALERFLDKLGAPAEVITDWIVPGHTLVQPLFDMATTVALTSVLVWCVLWILGRVRRVTA